MRYLHIGNVFYTKRGICTITMSIILHEVPTHWQCALYQNKHLYNENEYYIKKKYLHIDNECYTEK